MHVVVVEQFFFFVKERTVCLCGVVVRTQLFLLCCVLYYS